MNKCVKLEIKLIIVKNVNKIRSFAVLLLLKTTVLGAVYFDQLSGAVPTQKLVEIHYSPVWV